MFNSMIFKKSLLNEDIPYDVADLLFRERHRQKLSLEEVCAQTNVDLLEIDSLECGCGDIDFNSLICLLDFYKLKLKNWHNCFPGLPKDFYQKYFD